MMKIMLMSVDDDHDDDVGWRINTKMAAHGLSPFITVATAKRTLFYMTKCADQHQKDEK
jgi:hypothetical protein